jgi:L-lactate dehydrogenase complex protein LldE
MAEQKVQHALDANVEYIVATDTPCLMHLDGYMKAAGKPMKVMHIADVLASGWL